MCLKESGNNYSPPFLKYFRSLSRFGSSLHKSFLEVGQDAPRQISSFIQTMLMRVGLFTVRSN
ncbi:MAG: hypothetical protein DMF56_12290 [Acidobacteria bacterium]|nr:MAG: hypothetical protein DMF56_12290 [Acidobacteriota bacterium]